MYYSAIARKFSLAIFTVIAFTGVANAQFLDFNFDGNCDSADLDLLCSMVGNPNAPFFFDLDGDGQITAGEPLATGGDPLVGDVNQFLFWLAVKNQCSAPYMRGDANLDGVVDGFDFLALRENIFQRGNWSQGDFTCDGFVDGQDFVLWNMNRFTSNCD